MRLLIALFLLFLSFGIFTPLEAWDGPPEAFGLRWGTPLESAMQAFPGGQLGQDVAFTTVYYTTVAVNDMRLKAAFQFVPQRGLQGAMLWFPVTRLAAVVAVFERQYGRAPIRRNAEWQWEGAGMRISLGNYPAFSARSGRVSGRTGVAWLRTKALEQAIARGEPAAESKGRAPLAVSWPSSYEKQIARKIYWQLRYPATTPGIYLVSLTFQLSRTGQATKLQIAVEPSNPDVAESVRAAFARAQPFPVLPSLVHRARPEPITLTLTVSILQ